MKEDSSLLVGSTNSYGGTESEDDVTLVVATNSLYGLTVNLVMIGLGTGVLTQAWGLAGASVIPGLITLAFVLLVNYVTIMILIHAAEKTQIFDLSILMGKIPVFGRSAELFCYGMTVMSLGFPLIGYYIVLADSLEPFLPTSGLLSSRAVVLFLIMLALIPLCFLDQRRLSFTSTMSVLVNIDILVLIFAQFVTSGTANNICLFGLSTGTVAFFSALMFTILIQMCVLPMYEQLENRTPQRFSQALTYAFFFLYFLFGVFALLPYLVYGPHVRSNVLLDLPISIWGNVTRLGMMLVVASIFPLLVLPLVYPFPAVRSTPFGNVRVRDVAVLFWAASLMIPAIFLKDLGFLNVFSGALSVFGFLGVFPGLAGLFLLDMDSPAWRASMWGLMVFAGIMSILGVIYTSNEVETTNRSCTWKLNEHHSGTH